MLHLIFFFCSSAITSLKPYDWCGTVLVLCLLFGININRPPLMFMLSWFRQSSIHFQVTLERMPLPTHPSQILTSGLALFLGCHFPGGVPTSLPHTVSPDTDGVTPRKGRTFSLAWLAQCFVLPLFGN